MTVVLVRSYSRIWGNTSKDTETEAAGSCSLSKRLSIKLVGRVLEGVDQANSDRFDIRASQCPDHRPRLRPHPSAAARCRRHAPARQLPTGGAGGTSGSGISAKTSYGE